MEKRLILKHNIYFRGHQAIEWNPKEARAPSSELHKEPGHRKIDVIINQLSKNSRRRHSQQEMARKFG